MSPQCLTAIFSCGTIIGMGLIQQPSSKVPSRHRVGGRVIFGGVESGWGNNNVDLSTSKLLAQENIEYEHNWDKCWAALFLDRIAGPKQHVLVLRIAQSIKWHFRVSLFNPAAFIFYHFSFFAPPAIHFDYFKSILNRPPLPAPDDLPAAVAGLNLTHRLIPAPIFNLP